MEIWLPADKLARIKQLLTTWLPRRKARKRQILSLVGTLDHATKVVRPGRAFVARIYSTAAKLCKMHFVTRLNNKSIQIRFAMVVYVSAGWNGFSILRHPTISHPDFCVQTDASGAWGCAAVLAPYWLQ